MSESQSINTIYILKNNLSHSILFAYIRRRLQQADSLAAIGALIDFEASKISILNHYLWALSDLIHEANWLFTKLTENKG